VDQEEDRFCVDLGERLRDLRAARRISQSRLGELAGVTKSFVSQVERGKVMPSITTIRRITTALGSTLTRLFDEAPDHHPHDHIIVRSERRRSLTIPGRNVQLFLLAPDVNRAMEPLYNVLKSGQATCEEPMAHEGEEWLYLQKGTARLVLGDEQFALRAGDAAYFDSKTPHQLVNVGEGQLEIIWVVTPPLY
jgi:transcriptional regulator with XRE-family HTH domain